MNKYRLAGVAVAAAVATPMSAYALNFDFSFTGHSGATVTGEIFGLASSGPSAAADIFIDSVPTTLNNPAVPYDLFPKLSHIMTNIFSVSAGKITEYSFFGYRSHPGYLAFTLSAKGSDGYFTLNNGTVLRKGGHVTFTPAAAAAVPEPASIALLGAGLAGISAFRRRRFN